MNVRGRNGAIITGFRVFLYLNTEKVLRDQMQFNSLCCVSIKITHFTIVNIFFKYGISLLQ